MTILKHENFPDGMANLIRHYEFQLSGETCLVFPEQEYGDASPEEWMELAGKPGRMYRPAILTIDAGFNRGSISRKAMQACGCTFIVLQKAWFREPVRSFAWRILKAWPDIVAAAQQAHEAGKQCRIDVPLKGKVKVSGL